MGTAFLRQPGLFNGVWCGLLRCGRAGGGFQLSRHVLEQKLELGGVELLAFAAEEAADQVVELGFEKSVGLLERFDLTILAGDGLFRCFDADDTAWNAPTTRFTLL